MALAERAQNYLTQGKKAMARKDLERILAEDSSYEGVRDQLAELVSLRRGQGDENSDTELNPERVMVGDLPRDLCLRGPP